MPAEPATATAEPQHPIAQLTTSEISRYRRELEHALKTLPEHATVRELLQQRLAEVMDEVNEREKIARG
jgi:hypothetical protein